jgi:hypothetical protein
MAKIFVDGVETTASSYTSMPLKGHHRAQALLDGVAYEFICTKGKGQGTEMKHVAYYKLAGKIYYFYTKPGFLPNGADVRVETQPGEVKAPKKARAPRKPKAPKVTPVVETTEEEAQAQDEAA